MGVKNPEGNSEVKPNLRQLGRARRRRLGFLLLTLDGLLLADGRRMPFYALEKLGGGAHESGDFVKMPGWVANPHD